MSIISLNKPQSSNMNTYVRRTNDHVFCQWDNIKTTFLTSWLGFHKNINSVKLCVTAFCIIYNTTQGVYTKVS